MRNFDREMAKIMAVSDPRAHEITPDMIEAGAAVLSGFQTFTTDEEYWAKLVYKAMELERVRHTI